MQVLVFITNVKNAEQVGLVEPILDGAPEISNWNFDLDDCDNILRVESGAISPQYIEYLLKTAGFDCRELVY